MVRRSFLVTFARRWGGIDAGRLYTWDRFVRDRFVGQLPFLRPEPARPRWVVTVYEIEVEIQRAGAAVVLTRKADFYPGVAAAAGAVGLDFIPLAGERWDLAVPEAFREEPEWLFRKPVAKNGSHGTS